MIEARPLIAIQCEPKVEKEGKKYPPKATQG
jgi:hypothetical protein